MKSGALKVGIIGHKGFVGSAFYEVFAADKKYDATGIDSENYDSCIGSDFEILVNANGNSSKLLAQKDPIKDFEMNVASTLGFSHDFSFRHLVHVSSVEVYENKGSVQTTKEDTPINPAALSNYGASKFLGEQVAKKCSKSWLILRLASLVGSNMKKGPAYDILAENRLYISERSHFHFMNTLAVAQIAKKLAEEGGWNQIYNVVGKGRLSLGDFASIAGATLVQKGSEVHDFDINVQKLEQKLTVPSSREAVKSFVDAWQKK